MSERTITLLGGERITVRPLAPEDADAVRRAFGELSPATLRSRFFTPVPRLTAAITADLTLVDDERRTVLLALDQAGRVLGEARAVRRRDEPTVAEVAVTVADSHQRRGLGRALLRALRSEARRAGIAALQGHVLTDNAAAQALLQRSGATTWIAEPGVLGFDIALRTRTAPTAPTAPTMGLAS